MLRCLWLLQASFFVLSIQAFSPSKLSASLPTFLPAASSPQHHGLSHAENEGEGGSNNRGPKMILKRRPSPDKGRPKYRTDEVSSGTVRNSHGPELGPAQQEVAATKPRSINKRDYSFSIATAAPPTQSDSISIHQDGTDYSYFSPVAFGTSGKIMYLLVDTGATNTWIMGSDCKTKSCGAHHTFGKEDSTTLETDGATFGLGYGTGSVTGEIVNDTVTMGGLSTFTTFGLATNVSDEFSLYPIDGILALGRPGSGIPGFPATMKAVIESKVLDANLIGINLNRASDGTADGELNFGSPDTTKYSGDLSYVNTVSGSETWEISVDDMVVNGIACNFTGKTAFIDTGTTLMLFPTQDAQRLHSLIPRSQQVDKIFQIPCSSEILMQIKISGITYNVRAEDYVGKPIEGGDLCSSNIVGGLETSGNNQWILGDSFLKNVYTVFDFDKNRIGFGIKDTPTSSKSSTATTTLSTESAILRAKPTPEASSTLFSLLPESPSSTATPKTSNGPQQATIATPSSNGSSAMERRYALLSLCLFLVYFTFLI